MLLHICKPVYSNEEYSHILWKLWMLKIFCYLKRNCLLVLQVLKIHSLSDDLEANCFSICRIQSFSYLRRKFYARIDFLTNRSWSFILALDFGTFYFRFHSWNLVFAKMLIHPWVIKNYVSELPDDSENLDVMTQLFDFLLSTSFTS